MAQDLKEGTCAFGPLLQYSTGDRPAYTYDRQQPELEPEPEHRRKLLDQFSDEGRQIGEESKRMKSLLVGVGIGSEVIGLDIKEAACESLSLSTGSGSDESGIDFDPNSDEQEKQSVGFMMQPALVSVGQPVKDGAPTSPMQEQVTAKAELSTVTVGSTIPQKSQSNYVRTNHQELVHSNRDDPNLGTVVVNLNFEQHRHQPQSVEHQNENEGTRFMIEQKQILHAPHHNQTQRISTVLPGEPSSHRNINADHPSSSPKTITGYSYQYYHKQKEQQQQNVHGYTLHGSSHQQHYFNLYDPQLFQQNLNTYIPNLNYQTQSYQHNREQLQITNNNNVPPHPTPIVTIPLQNETRLQQLQELQTEGLKDLPGVGKTRIYPDGLDDLWKQTPVECQRMITPQDVPLSARDRGYFTVSELLALKRCLLSRLETVRREGGSAGFITSGGASFENSQNNTQKCNNLLQPFIILRQNPLEINVAAASAQEADVNRNPLGLGGGAVRKAMESLGDQHNSKNNSDFGILVGVGGVLGHLGSSTHVIKHTSEASSLASAAAIELDLGGSGISRDPQILPQQITPRSLRQPNGNSTVNSRDQTALSHSRSEVQGERPAPLFRAATLVFKLLKIGSYEFRSFSATNPNRFRVLYNSQKIIYECHLPTAPPNDKSLKPFRKILKFDINFDQISQVQFGNDQIYLRVVGAPALNVLCTPSCEEESTVPFLSVEDQNLLDEIENGKLLLNPHHTIYFLNERLVRSLASNFQEHPRFRHLFYSGDSSLPKHT